ncbi:hypothetical protein A1O1_02986 [Capronia coronata CBS 617.96]|uniref:Uncharacterized protein n=1 Tax=Capronia coronata CBS 617.96 TaxID=1182541 RepID=W9YY28_9EURO|nr:uncharacterized protein A1O1_02986 [Capronia coronata CBS 617.96]EXJ94590.1 hypothetical protein A1O1_02986 [Capronia coronata CBS 617.96]
MPLLRKTSLISLALVLLAAIYLIRHVYLVSGPRYLYGQDGLLYNPDLFSPGTVKPAGQNYSRVLVMGHLRSEDVSWVATELPDLPTKIYTVDAEEDANEESASTSTSDSGSGSGSPSGLPANKGHEAMVYLTYIIEHYDALPDVVLFFHPHRKTWHNNILLDVDSATTIKLLSDAHVVRQGYFNTRCHLDPGCPDWLHVDRPWWRHDLKHKPEEPAWTSALFHALHGADVPIPKAISQPCCAQFAVSGERIRQRPRADYVRYRDWLLATDLDDRTSGRIMEYSWQYIFTGKFEFCPSQHRCYCDGYGICFDGERGLQTWLDTVKEKENIDRKLVGVWDHGGNFAAEKYKRLARDRKHLADLLDSMREQALRRGFDPKTRAEECGREWHEGDGF